MEQIYLSSSEISLGDLLLMITEYGNVFYYNSFFSVFDKVGISDELLAVKGLATYIISISSPDKSIPAAL